MAASHAAGQRDLAEKYQSQVGQLNATIQALNEEFTKLKNRSPTVIVRRRICSIS